MIVSHNHITYQIKLFNQNSRNINIEFLNCRTKRNFFLVTFLSCNFIFQKVFLGRKILFVKWKFVFSSRFWHRFKYSCFHVHWSFEWGNIRSLAQNIKSLVQNLLLFILEMKLVNGRLYWAFPGLSYLTRISWLINGKIGNFRLNFFLWG